MEFYSQKEQLYFTNARIDLISLMPDRKDSKVLEVGAGGGDTLIEIKKKGLASEVVGIELMEMPDTNQKDRAIDRFLICDIEKTNPDLPKEYFDVIIMGDVLEHLLDPWAFLDKISTYLKKEGLILASIPNIRYYTACSRVFLHGNFGYESQGLFDRTHFRFFCKKNMLQLFDKPFLKTNRIVPRDHLYDVKSKKKFLNKITFGILEEFLTFQYIVVAQKI